MTHFTGLSGGSWPSVPRYLCVTAPRSSVCLENPTEDNNLNSYNSNIAQATGYRRAVVEHSIMVTKEIYTEPLEKLEGSFAGSLRGRDSLFIPPGCDWKWFATLKEGQSTGWGAGGISAAAKRAEVVSLVSINVLISFRWGLGKAPAHSILLLC